VAGHFSNGHEPTAAKPSAAVKGAAPVLSAKVARENYALDLDAIGTVRSFESIDISSNVTESVTQLSFNDGDFVKKGTLLALLSDSEEQAMLASAKATLAEEEREIERLKNLVKDGAAPEARLAERKTLADIAKQKIFEAEAKLADRRITAPFDGWLGLRRISVGALVTPGTVIASLDKIDVVKIDFSVPETYLGTVKPGTAIAARTDSDREQQDTKGKVSHLDSRIDPMTRSVATRAEVPNPDLALKPGMLVMVRSWWSRRCRSPFLSVRWFPSGPKPMCLRFRTTRRSESRSKPAAASRALSRSPAV
jgi:membrane fusion protein (multidrug efflux system)